MRNPTTVTVETENQQLYWQASSLGMRQEKFEVFGGLYFVADTSFVSKFDSFRARIVFMEVLAVDQPLGNIQRSIADYPDNVIIAEAYRRLKLSQPPDPREMIDRIKMSVDYSMSATDVARMLEEHPYLKETNK